MNAVWSKLVKSAYRKEPISSFIVIVGAVDAVIGGADESLSLLTFGLGTVGVAIAWRWWQLQRQQAEIPDPTPKYMLPPQSSRQALPLLTSAKRKSSL